MITNFFWILIVSSLLEFDVGLDFRVKSLHFGSDGLKLGFVLWFLEELGRFHELSLNFLHLVLEMMANMVDLVFDLIIAVDELFDILLEEGIILFELFSDFVVHGNFPHFGLWVKFKVVLEFIVKGLELAGDFIKLLTDLIGWVFDLHLELLESHVHLVNFFGDIHLQVVEFTLN